MNREIRPEDIKTLEDVVALNQMAQQQTLPPEVLKKAIEIARQARSSAVPKRGAGPKKSPKEKVDMAALEADLLEGL